MHEERCTAASRRRSTRGSTGTGTSSSTSSGTSSSSRRSGTSQSFLPRGSRRPPRHTDPHAHAPTETPPKNIYDPCSLSPRRTRFLSRGPPPSTLSAPISYFEPSFSPRLAAHLPCLPYLPACPSFPLRVVLAPLIEPNQTGIGRSVRPGVGLLVVCVFVVCSDFFFFFTCFIKLWVDLSSSAFSALSWASRNDPTTRPGYYRL